MDQYKYQSLQTKNTIRILALDPGKQGYDIPLTGVLENVPIDSAGSYETVSYVWADPGPPNTAYNILIRGSDNPGRLLMLRGGSIYAALCKSRLPDRRRRVWADQCCINQDDPMERSQQLQLMNKIYQDAVHVLVWLGLDTKQEAVSAFRLVHQLDQVSKGCQTRHISHDLDLETHISENQMALQALADRPWFKRGWIVQEIVTNTPATMIWGDAAIAWDALASVCERLKSYHHLRYTLAITTSDISFLFRRLVEPDENTHHANRFNFVYELQRARHLQFSDDRDRVFAFLGHFSVQSHHPLGCGPVSIRADYTKTVEETYIDVAVRILRANPGVICIILAAVQHPPHSLPIRGGNPFQAHMDFEAWLGDNHRLPSWVPDWRLFKSIVILAEPICPHQAHGDSIAKLKILKGDAFVLRIHGVEFGTIEVCSRPLRSNDFYNKKTLGQQSTTIEYLWHRICRARCFNLSDGYLNGQTAFFAFMQTLSNGCVQAAGHGRRPYYEVPDREWLQKAAKHITETLGASGDVSEEVKEAAQGTEHEAHDEGGGHRHASPG
ncbi:heterokaryon incompatibility protein-domain-containing protein [Xylariaceae sp. FL1272]|nr:heterokaryon incompatibility protein-domain-containing protein [Xylariaceae sp. FL1272]